MNSTVLVAFLVVITEYPRKPCKEARVYGSHFNTDPHGGKAERAAHTRSALKKQTVVTVQLTFPFFSRPGIQPVELCWIFQFQVTQYRNFLAPILRVSLLGDFVFCPLMLITTSLPLVKLAPTHITIPQEAVQQWFVR